MPQLAIAIQWISVQCFPRSESSWFGFYEHDNLEKINDLQDTDLYQQVSWLLGNLEHHDKFYLQDWLGLHFLNTKGRLHFLQKDGNHLDFDRGYFHHQLLVPFLNNTIMVKK